MKYNWEQLVLNNLLNKQSWNNSRSFNSCPCIRILIQHPLCCSNGSQYKQGKAGRSLSSFCCIEMFDSIPQSYSVTWVLIHFGDFFLDKFWYRSQGSRACKNILLTQSISWVFPEVAKEPCWGHLDLYLCIACSLGGGVSGLFLLLCTEQHFLQCKCDCSLESHFQSWIWTQKQ